MMIDFSSHRRHTGERTNDVGPDVPDVRKRADGVDGVDGVDDDDVRGVRMDGDVGGGGGGGGGDAQSGFDDEFESFRWWSRTTTRLLRVLGW